MKVWCDCLFWHEEQAEDAKPFLNDMNLFESKKSKTLFPGWSGQRCQSEGHEETWAWGVDGRTG